MTELVPRKYLTFLTLMSGILIALGIGIVYKAENAKTAPLALRNTFSIETVSTQEQIVRGLSGRERIDKYAVMAFVFPENEERCFWMKDMRFNIDIVWLDSQKKVTAIESNVSPQSYPKTFCNDARYVLEFAEGRASELGLQSGRAVRF